MGGIRKERRMDLFSEEEDVELPRTEGCVPRPAMMWGWGD